MSAGDKIVRTVMLVFGIAAVAGGASALLGRLDIPGSRAALLIGVGAVATGFALVRLIGEG